MHFFHTIIYLCLLVFNLQNLQVDALLNITEEALITSRKLVKEVEGNLDITSEAKLHKKLNDVKKIAFDFEKNYRHEYMNNYNNRYEIHNLNNWFESVKENGAKNGIGKNLPLSFMKILLRFYQLTKKIDTVKWIVSKKLYLNSDEENNTVIYQPVEIYKTDFLAFAKNKYNLNVKRKMHIIGEIYQYRQDIFRDLYQLFFYTDEESHISIFEFLKNMTKYVPENTLMSLYEIELPHQLRLFNTISNLMVNEAIFCVYHQYNIALLKVYFEGYNYLKNDDRRALELIKQYWGEWDAVNIMKSYEEKFKERSLEVLNRVRPALRSLSRRILQHIQFYEIDDPNLVVKLNLFDKYIVNEVDLNVDGSCKNTCSDYKQVEKVFDCFDKGICSIHKKCKGKLWDCEDIVEPMHICPWDDEDKKLRRYRYIRGSNCNNGENCLTQETKAESWRRGFYKCSYCQCKCEENETNSNRYFSLRPATSNIEENYIIGSARFVTIENVVHLQVTQAKLLSNGYLPRADPVPIKGFRVTDSDIKAGKDFQAVTLDARTICLDELNSPKDHVLTGLRLKFQDGYFKLEIRMTLFDYRTGKLHPERSVWYSKDTDLHQRPIINLDDFHREPKSSVKYEGCFQFTANETENNAGLETIPYIQKNTLSNLKFVPLSGAGLILKNEGNQFLDLQFIIQDLVRYT